MNFEKLDRIELSVGDVDKVRKWFEYHHESGQEKEINFPLEEGLIVVGGKLLESVPYNEVMIHFKIKDSIHFSLYIQDSRKPDSEPMLSWVIDETFLETGKFEWKSGFKRVSLSDKDAQKHVAFQTAFAFELFSYMTNVTENIIEKKADRIITKKGKGKGKKGRKKRKVKISVTRYIIDHERSESGKRYERHTPAWTVRGHWRYYKKTGKRVWIDGYVKGQGETKDGRIYKI